MFRDFSRGEERCRQGMFAFVVFMTCGCFAAPDDMCAWKATGWARFSDKANWSEGRVPTGRNSLKPGTMYFDLGGENVSVGSVNSVKWDPLDFGVRNGTLTFMARYRSRINNVRVERGGVLKFDKGCDWVGGLGMGADRCERLSVCDGGRVELRGSFNPWHAALDIAPGGTMLFAPKEADFANSNMGGTLTNRGLLEMPSGFRWAASGRPGSVFSIVQKDGGVLKIGGPIWGFENDSIDRGGKVTVSIEGGRIEVSGDVAFIDFASCSIAPGANVVIDVPDGCSFDLSSFRIGKGAKIVKKGGGTIVIGGGAPPDELIVEAGGTSFIPVVVKKAVAPAFSIPDRRRNPYEPKTPMLAKKKDGTVAGLKPGFHGRNAGLVRLDGENVIGDESVKAWKAVAWRNESVHGQFVAWSSDGVSRMRVEVSRLETESGDAIPASSVSTRFVRYVVGHASYKGEVTQPEKLFGDCLDDAEQLDVPPAGYRPVWLTVKVPADAKPGIYRGMLTIRANASDKLEFPLELAVGERVLPSPSQWKTFIDIWQHPWAISRYHCVKPFSKLHYELMEPYYRELASLGQKVITATVVDRPWGQGNNYEGFGSMVEVIRRRDGSWAYDYTVFDEYVEFAKRCGIGPQIHCYTLAGFKTSFTDESTGEKLLKLNKQDEQKKYWTLFLKDFERHIARKGWLGDVYLALDESSPEVLRAAERLLRTAAPGLKLAMAGNRNPSAYAGVSIDAFSLYFRYVSPSFLEEVKARRKKGLTTSYYICCGPRRPNTFLSSPLCESAWQGVYTAGTGIDGMLRWAAFTWPRDPLFDGSFINWPPGDTYLIYPGPRSSTRWEMLRDGIELAEKIRILRDEGKMTPELEKLLDPASFKRTAEFYEERTAAVFDAVDGVKQSD